MEFPKLHRAILFGTELEARSWLESNEQSVECVDFFKRTIAHVAAERGRVHLLEDILLERRRSFDTRDAFNLTPLIIAVMHGHLDSCRLLLEAKFEREARDSTGRNLLSIACRRAHHHIVEYLVNHLEFPLNDHRGGYTCSPIHDAIESGNFQICRLLINLGADLNTPFNNKRPANLALEKGHDQILHLINKKAEEPSITGLNSNGAAPAYTGFPSEPILQYNMVANNDHPFPQQYSPNGHMHDMTPYAPGFTAWTFGNLGHPGTDSASLGTS
jgi:ankyrin repeat protein